ncbi:hypothetical protein [Pelagicoccus sp. SDUM812002]|uniref:hypothetical protein n=1 Tax=Pelagicoccus sp. SDUM812002 TaxID=3041266 RepID=UPI0028103D8F|nr:hypothetical protein [Pelagicoccus sp. SDUM812002]MDQ8185568.1 hypothetical protein [Pelagicoccus sp. SDUM812002]
MHVIDKATHDGSCLRILGWCFKPSTEVKAVHAIFADRQDSIEGYGQESPDLIQHFGEVARDARFAFSIETTERTCTLDFKFTDGSSARADIDLTSQEPPLKAIEHRIQNGTYTGKFQVSNPDPDPVQRVHFLVKTDNPAKRAEPIDFAITNVDLAEIHIDEYPA